MKDIHVIEDCPTFTSFAKIFFGREKIIYSPKKNNIDLNLFEFRYYNRIDEPMFDLFYVHFNRNNYYADYDITAESLQELFSKMLFPISMDDPTLDGELLTGKEIRNQCYTKKVVEFFFGKENVKCFVNDNHLLFQIYFYQSNNERIWEPLRIYKGEDGYTAKTRQNTVKYETDVWDLEEMLDEVVFLDSTTSNEIYGDEIKSR